MKQQIKINKNPKSLERSVVFNATVGDYIATLQMPIKVKFKAPFNEQKDGFNIFLIQNKGKGPPGG